MANVSTLALYGAGLSPDGFIITPRGVTTRVRPVLDGKRLRVMSDSDDLLYAGPAEPASLCTFVERFWYWEKTCN